MTRQVITIDGRREGYSAEQIAKNKRTVTVKFLIKYLEEFDDDALVMISNDNGYTYGSITWDSFGEEYIGKDEEEE